MQIISNEELQQIINEAKAAGKDVTALEQTLQDSVERMAEVYIYINSLPMGICIE